jgi:hypothetical protein
MISDITQKSCNMRLICNPVRLTISLLLALTFQSGSGFG